MDILTNCYLEPDLKKFKPGEYIQFERLGYFIADPDSSEDNLIFNRTMTLRDNWEKILKQQEREKNIARKKAKRKKNR